MAAGVFSLVAASVGAILLGHRDVSVNAEVLVLAAVFAFPGAGLFTRAAACFLANADSDVGVFLEAQVLV